MWTGVVHCVAMIICAFKYPVHPTLQVIQQFVKIQPGKFKLTYSTLFFPAQTNADTIQILTTAQRASLLINLTMSTSIIQTSSQIRPNQGNIDHPTVTESGNKREILDVMGDSQPDFRHLMKRRGSKTNFQRIGPQNEKKLQNK